MKDVFYALSGLGIIRLLMSTTLLTSVLGLAWLLVIILFARRY